MSRTIEETSDDEIESLLKVVKNKSKNENKIKYDICFNRPNNFTPKEIKFDDVDKYDFSKGFTEFLISEKYVHLYFDFDSISSEDEFLDVYNWLEKLEFVFGPFSYGGYCNNEEMATYGFRQFNEGGHFLSMHVVFYETCISTVDLQKIMKHTAKKGFSTKGIHRLCDPNVYKLVSKKEGQTTRQLFRHVLADKIYKVGDEQNKLNHGTIIGGKKPSTQIVQIRGNERVIKENEWKQIFTVCENEMEEKNAPMELVKKEPKKNNGDKQMDKCPQMDLRFERSFEAKPLCAEAADFIERKNDELNANDKLIMLSSDEMDELLNEFEPTYEVFTSIVSNLMHSPYGIDEVKEMVERWYFRAEHQNQNTIEIYCDKYYEQVMNNKWFYSLMKHLEPEARNKWIGKYGSVGIDDTMKIEMDDEFNLSKLRTNDYSLKGGVGVDVNKFINDLKKCVVVINSAEMLFVVKDYDGVRDTNKLTFLTDKGFERLMKSIKVGKYYKDGKIKPVNAFMIYDEGKNKNYLMKDGMRFYDKRENMFSYFTGYEYNEVDSVDENVIAGFLNHVKEVIANGNDEMYEYILNWYSYILQKPDGKTGTCLVFTGKQGTGKNVFTDVLCKLMSKYANSNLTRIDDVVGKFNTALENMKLVICNEMSSAETNKYLNSDALKSVITENQIDVNQKCMPVRTIQNVCNLILLSNHSVPVKIESGDRRYVVSETSDRYKGNFGYFEKLCGSFNDAFYENLYTYFMRRDISKFNPRIMPDSEAKDDIINASKSSYELFIQDKIHRFIEGFDCSVSFGEYKIWAKDNGFMSCNVKTYGLNIKQFCDRKRISTEQGRIWVYQLKESMKNNFEIVNDDDEDVETAE